MATAIFLLLLGLKLCFGLEAPAAQNPIHGHDEHSVLQTCTRIYQAQPEIVKFPGDDDFESGQDQYWSSRQAARRPICRLIPSSSQQVSDLLSHLNHEEPDVLLSSGGHATAMINPENTHFITLDLSRLNSIAIGQDYVELGTGARWLDVYRHLDPLNITVPGARAGSVGVGGFLLRGGISTSSATRGWSCDNVLSAEIVLANGTIIEANSNACPELLKCIRGGGSDFGIVTKFRVQSFAVKQFQVGFVRYDESRIRELVAVVVNVAAKTHEDPELSFELSIALNQSSLQPFGFLMLTRFAEIAASPILHNFIEIPHSDFNVDDVSSGDLADNVDLNNPKGYRQHKCTLTLKIRADTAFEIVAAFVEAMKRSTLLQDPGYRPAMLLQILPQARHSARHQPAGNMLGLDAEREPLLLISFEVRWLQAKLDDLYLTALDNLLAFCRSLAEERGHLHPFVYANYAAASQNVFANLEARGMLEHVKVVRDLYDPTHYWTRHLRQPFLLQD